MSTQITLDELAVMVNNGFKEVNNDLVTGLQKINNDLTVGFKKAHDDLSEFKYETMARFDSLEKKFDSLEKVVYNDHEPRLRKVERKLAVA